MHTQIVKLLEASDSDKHRTGCHQYGIFYDLLFDALFLRKGDKLNILEIGVSKYDKGSLDVWQSLKSYVDIVVGIDTVQYRGELKDNTTFYMMNAYEQNTIEVLKREHPPFHIIIDDGSHKTDDQRYFLENYTQVLSEIGYLICEDVRDVDFYTEMCSQGYYGIDLTGNRPEGENPVDDDRLLIYPSYHFTPQQQSEKTPVTFPKNYTVRDTKVSVSIPIYAVEQVQGAVLSSVGTINNTDLGEKGCQLVFHIDKTIENDVVPVLQSYNVPTNIMRTVTIKSYPTDITTAPLGRTFMGLIDTEKAGDTWLIIKPNTVIGTTQNRFQWYDTLSTLDTPSALDITEYTYDDDDYINWLEGIRLAAGGNPIHTHDKEIDIIKRIGFDFQPVFSYGTMPRINTNTSLFAVPSQHAIVPFLSEFFQQCYQDEMLMGLWYLQNNINSGSLKQLLNIPVYSNETEFESRDKEKDVDGYITYLK